MSRRPASLARGILAGLASVPLLAASVACGGDAAPAPLAVEIVSLAGDGAVPEVGWRLKAEDAREVPLTSTRRPGAHEGVLFEARAAAGRFAVVGPEPWSLVGGPVFVAMEPGLEPVALGVGRKYTLYLMPPEGRSVGDVVLRVAGKPTSPRRDPIPFERADGADRRTALRIAPADWTGAAQIHAAIGKDTFARLEPVSFPADGTCTGVSLLDGFSVAVVVHLVPARPAPGPLVVVADGDEFSIRKEAIVDERGLATFDRFPQTGRQVRFAIGGEPGRPGVPTWAMPGPEAARGDLRLLAADPGPGGRIVRLHLPPGAPPVGRVQGRAPTSATYAVLADVVREGDDLVVPLPAGAWSVLVATADLVARVDVAADARDATVALATACLVQMTVEGGVPQGRRFVLEGVRVEGDREVTAQGWVHRLVARTDLEVTAPPGRYRFRLSEGARVAPWTDVVLEQPSTRAAIRLPPPR